MYNPGNCKKKYQLGSKTEKELNKTQSLQQKKKGKKTKWFIFLDAAYQNLKLIPKLTIRRKYRSLASKYVNTEISRHQNTVNLQVQP